MADGKVSEVIGIRVNGFVEVSKYMYTKIVQLTS